MCMCECVYKYKVIESSVLINDFYTHTRRHTIHVCLFWSNDEMKSECCGDSDGDGGDGDDEFGHVLSMWDSSIWII